MTLTLNDVETGRTVRITRIDDTDVATQAVRMGLTAGCQVTCIARIPAGPTVIQLGGMELALGRDLCCGIQVEPS